MFQPMRKLDSIKPKKTRRHNLTGQRFSRWLVLERSHAKRVPAGTVIYWLCRCDCGTERSVSAGLLLGGGSKSCGCLQKDAHRAQFFKHGHAPVSRTGKKASPEYKSWAAMRGRCYGRGYGYETVPIDPRWEDFRNFLADMGQKPSASHSLDRIDNTQGYSPSNCRWATVTEQNRNTSHCINITWNGRTQVLQAWADEFGINRSTLARRLKILPLAEAMKPRIRKPATTSPHPSMAGSVATAIYAAWII